MAMWRNSDTLSMNDIPLQSILPELVMQLERCDLISLVFLLCDIPGRALDMIISFLRTRVRDRIIKDWVNMANSRESWKDEFLEALCVCQLYKAIRYLGLNVDRVRNHFECDSAIGAQQTLYYVDRMKVALYTVCENITSEKLQKLINCLSTFNIVLVNSDYCELIFLHLMCTNFITVKHTSDEKGCEYEIEVLARIIDGISGLSQDAGQLRTIAQLSSVPLTPQPSIVSDEGSTDCFLDNLDGIEDALAEMAGINLEVATSNLRADSTRNDIYTIKNRNRLGICFIINEEIFYPSSNSINNNIEYEPLTNRDGSTLDVCKLRVTMNSLKIKPISCDNLDHKQIFDYIRHVIQKCVQPSDSLFMLGILSHGVKDHVFTVDSATVNIDTIKEFVGSELQERNIDIPKVIFIQACQVDTVVQIPNAMTDTAYPLRKEAMASDSKLQWNDNIQIPLQESINPYYPKLVPAASTSVVNKETGPIIMTPDSQMLRDGQRATARNSDFLIFYATSPKLAAFRQEVSGVHVGSVFIDRMCQKLNELADSKHLVEIFTAVNNEIKNVFSEINYDQVSIFKTSLTKSLYLKTPQ